MVIVIKEWYYIRRVPRIHFCVLALYESYRHLVVRNFLISISVIVFIVTADFFY